MLLFKALIATFVTAPIDVLALKIDPAAVPSDDTNACCTTVNTEDEIFADEAADDPLSITHIVFAALAVTIWVNAVSADPASSPPDDMAPKVADVRLVPADARNELAPCRP